MVNRKIKSKVEVEVKALFFFNHTRFNTSEGLCEIYIQSIDETQASRLFLISSLIPVLLLTKKDLYSRALKTRIYEFSFSLSYSGSSVAKNWLNRPIVNTIYIAAVAPACILSNFLRFIVLAFSLISILLFLYLEHTSSLYFIVIRPYP